MRIKHVSFVTPDADALIHFYNAFAATILKDVYNPAEGLRRVVLQFGEQKIQFFQPDEPPQSKDYSWMEHIAFETREFEELYQTLKTSGAQFSKEKGRSPSGKRLFFVLDPDGRQLEILDASL